MPITPVTPSTLSLTDVAPPMSAIDGRLLSYGAPMGDYLFVLREDLTPRALSRIAADATIRIRPNARRERSPARPWRTCAATLRLSQNAGPRRSPARSLKNWRVKRRLKPLPNFASDRPWPPGTRVQRPHSRHRPAREHAHQGRASVLAPTQSRHRDDPAR